MLSKAKCLQLYIFFVIWNEIHDWLPVFGVAPADKQFLFFLHANEWYRKGTELNICFDLNLHSLTIQVKHASRVPEACDVI